MYERMYISTCVWLQTVENAQSPEVFISYQWGKQPQVKQLYKQLVASGYSCWLDIMQMGGGDSLYDKIDKGVRGCKVVVSCVTSKYAISANCRREVSLADAVKKPIIPLLLEKVTWPPEGPMSLVFTHLLYIDCCKPNADVIQNDWSASLPQMQELYGKLVDHVPRVKLMALDETPDTTSQGPKHTNSGQPPSNGETKVTPMNTWEDTDSNQNANKTDENNGGEPVVKLNSWTNDKEPAHSNSQAIQATHAGAHASNKGQGHGPAINDPGRAASPATGQVPEKRASKSCTLL